MYDKKIGKMTNSDELIRYVLKQVARHAAACALGFLSSCAVLEGLTPFGAAFVAAVIPAFIPAAVLGNALGYFYLHSVTVLTLRYIAASAVAGIMAYVAKRSLDRRFHKYFSAVAAFFSLFVTGLIMSLSVTLSYEETALYFAEGLMGAAAAWFADRFAVVLPQKKNISRFTGIENVSAFVVFGILLLSLGSFPVFNVSPAVAAGAYAVLVTSFYAGEKTGALTGIVAGVVLGFGTPNTFLTGGMALGGLLCGLAGKKNRILSGMIFLTTVAVTAFASDDWIAAVYIIYAVAAGTAIFIATPKKIAKFYKTVFSVSDQTAVFSGIRDAVKMRLCEASESMTDITDSVKAVAGIYRRRSMPREENIYKNVISQVCRHCDNYDYCINRKFSETKENFESVASALKYGEEAENVPKKFFDICPEHKQVVKKIGYETEKYRWAMRESAKSGETVNIVADQFGAVAGLLDTYVSGMDSDEYDGERSALISEILKTDFGLEIGSCGVFRNTEDKIFCEIYFKPDKKYKPENAVRAIADALDIEFEKPVLKKVSGNVQSMTFCEKTKYAVRSGGWQISSENGNRCGDTFDTFFDGKGRFYMILSDGMGTGKRAAADSVICCSLASKLIRAGYPVDGIIKMINSSMLVRSGEESIATLDIAVIDLYTGEVEFFKAGAAHSVAMRKQKMLKIEKRSLPVGILGNVKFEKTEIDLHDGDSLVLMSDGVDESVNSAWRDILKDAGGYEGRELAEKLATAAHLHSDKESADDITVVTATVSIR